MIGKLTGTVDSIFDDSLILDVNGVGYVVFCSSRTLGSLESKTKISLIIQTIVREDAIILFGFLDNFEKSIFENLCKVSGIGGKLALKIMGSVTIEEILSAIDSEDSNMLCKAPGVGQKIASRIVVELKNLRKNIDMSNVNISVSSMRLTATSFSIDNDSRLKDALSALENLGYQKSLAYNIISNILKEREDIVIESLITEALKKINNF